MRRFFTLLALACILTAAPAQADVPSIFGRPHRPGPYGDSGGDRRTPIVVGVALAAGIAAGGVYLFRRRRK